MNIVHSRRKQMFFSICPTYLLERPGEEQFNCMSEAKRKSNTSERCMITMFLGMSWKPCWMRSEKPRDVHAGGESGTDRSVTLDTWNFTAVAATMEENARHQVCVRCVPEAGCKRTVGLKVDGIHTIETQSELVAFTSISVVCYSGGDGENGGVTHCLNCLWPERETVKPPG